MQEDPSMISFHMGSLRIEGNHLPHYRGNLKDLICSFQFYDQCTLMI